MKCLVIGAGGVGGSLAALLALAGNEVTCVARGGHKEKMGCVSIRESKESRSSRVMFTTGRRNVRERLVWLRPKLIGGRPS